MLLGVVGALMIVEAVRAIMRTYQGKPVVLRRPGSHTWAHGLPFKLRFKRSKIYVSAIPVWVIGYRHRLHRGDPGHRRRLPAGADADLFPARADRDRDRHIHRAHAGHDGVGDHHACGDQSSGRRDPGADPDGRRGERRAVRRARRPEHAGGTAAASARRAGARRRLPVRARSADPAERTVIPSASPGRPNETARAPFSCWRRHTRQSQRRAAPSGWSHRCPAIRCW